MGDIELEFDVARVNRFHDSINFVGRFSERARMIVIADRYTKIDGAFADLS